jgi:methylenetetrahydrofolate reductase (NADPH)
MPVNGLTPIEDIVRQQIFALMKDFTVETTPFSATKIKNFSEVLWSGTTVFVTFLPGSDFMETISVSKRLKKEGMRPVPHIAARSVPSKVFLDEKLDQLVSEADVDEILIIGGAIDRPAGQFSNSMQIMETGLIDKYNIKQVGVAGHPEGSPDIVDDELRQALISKNLFAERSDAELYVVTQLCFEAAPIIAWDKAIRAEGNKLPIRVGVPGIASLKALLSYAKACGVGQSMNFLKRQGRNFAKLMTMSTPDKQIFDLVCCKSQDPECGITGIHMYPLGGLEKTAKWTYALLDQQFDINKKRDGFTVNVDL